MRTRILAVILAAVMAAAVFAAVPVTAKAAGSDNAQSIAFNKQYYGSITEENTNSWYKFTLSSSGRVTLAATAEMDLIYYRIYDIDKKQYLQKFLLLQLKSVSAL